MRTFAVTAVIHATPERVWALLTDAAGYTRWNNTVNKVDGKIGPGEQVTVHPKINPGRAFPVKVTAFESPSRMVWTGGMPLGLFRGERTFGLLKRPDGAVEFSMREVFSGLMAPLIGRSIPDMQPVFEEFAKDLKAAAESGFML
jgi:uncharacterized protein YndB with AHSA1/START domain